jgi:hypothetical protein
MDLRPLFAPASSSDSVGKCSSQSTHDAVGNVSGDSLFQDVLNRGFLLFVQRQNSLSNFFLRRLMATNWDDLLCRRELLLIQHHLNQHSSDTTWKTLSKDYRKTVTNKMPKKARHGIRGSAAFLFDNSYRFDWPRRCLTHRRTDGGNQTDWCTWQTLLVVIYVTYWCALFPLCRSYGGRNQSCEHPQWPWFCANRIGRRGFQFQWKPGYYRVRNERLWRCRGGQIWIGIN